MKMLQQRMEKEKEQPITPVLAHLLSKEELQAIMKWLFIDNMDKQDLLEAIGNDLRILSYFLEKWKKELEEKVTPQKVYDVLCQLQLETHYLMTKILADWDEYDHSNFKALCPKAGAPLPLYAVFESSVQEKDKYISVPLSKYYATEWEAASKKSLLISEEQFEENQLQILSL